MRDVTDETRQRINAFAKEQRTHQLDRLRAEGVYQALVLRNNDIALDKHGRRMLQEATGLTSAQLDKALKLLCDAGVVGLETWGSNVVVTVRPEK